MRTRVAVVRTHKYIRVEELTYVDSIDHAIGDECMVGWAFDATHTSYGYMPLARVAELLFPTNEGR